MGIPWNGIGINCYVMGWDRQICPMDNPVKTPIGQFHDEGTPGLKKIK